MKKKDKPNRYLRVWIWIGRYATKTSYIDFYEENGQITVHPYYFNTANSKSYPVQATQQELDYAFRELYKKLGYEIEGDRMDGVKKW